MTASNIKRYLLNYSISVAGMAPDHPYLQAMANALRPTDPSAPEHALPKITNGHVHFAEVITSEDLKKLDQHLRGCFTGVMGMHTTIEQTVGDLGELIMAFNLSDESDKSAMMVAILVKPKGVAFSYGLEIATNKAVALGELTPVGNGKDMLDAVLAYFGEIQNVQTNVIH